MDAAATSFVMGLVAGVLVGVLGTVMIALKVIHK